MGLTLALVVGVAGLASAQRGGWGGRGMHGMGMGMGPGAGAGIAQWIIQEDGLDRLADRVELTDEQRGRLQDLVDSFRRENADALDRMARLQAERDSLLRRDARPRSLALHDSLMALGNKYNHPGDDLFAPMNRLGRDAFDVLTPDQQGLLARWGHMAPGHMQPGAVSGRGRPGMGAGAMRMHMLMRRPFHP